MSTSGKNQKTGCTFLIVRKNKILLFNIYRFKVKVLLKSKAIIGKNGFAYFKKEGDKKTPLGIFSPRLAFGLKERPETALNYVKITPDHYFVDDIKSRFYNMLVCVKKSPKDFSSAEHLFDFKSEYKYAIDIGYNKKCKKGRGSAIFLHCIGEKPYTAGCIAVKEKDMLICLKYINNKSKIIIIP